MMRIFLYFIKTIPGMDDWLDRKLIFEVFDLVQEIEDSKNIIKVKISNDGIDKFHMLQPGKSYALQFEYSTDEKPLQYFSLVSVEVEKLKNEDLYTLIFSTRPIPV